MKNTFRQMRGAAIVDYELAKRQLLLRVSGPVTPLVLKTVTLDVDRIATGMLAHSIAVDLSRAALAVSYEDLFAAPALLSAGVRALPIAYAPPSSAAAMFREFARNIAKDGLVRGIFPERAEQAQEWAARKAGLCPRPLHFRTLEVER